METHKVHLIPNVKKLVYTQGCLPVKAVSLKNSGWDKRIVAAAEKLPAGGEGIPLSISVSDTSGEGYTLDICQDRIDVRGEGPAGAFYAIQTLRQLFAQEKVPCLHIEDHPDFSYRGFYHDVTRGKIPKVETIKELIDRMAYYKLNSLQLYVEHTFEFDECRDINSTRGYLTRAELIEIGRYCRERFIDFIPSLSTFGHMYEVLQQPKYQHLRASADNTYENALWYCRMAHHTIDPRKPESLVLVQHMIDQYAPLFESEWFNICCDETNDLHYCADDPEQVGELYVGFVQKIIAHTQSHGKKVMMWADILLKHPQVIDRLPEDVCFLNWFYRKDPNEENFAHFARISRPQILCPGTSTWNRFCEDVEVEESNISQMAELAKKYGAKGILNTNWGDRGNPCSLELAMYGLVLGAEKSWSVDTAVDDAFYDRVDALLYERRNATCILKEVSQLNTMASWVNFGWAFHKEKDGIEPKDLQNCPIDLPKLQAAYLAVAQKLSGQVWKNDEYRQEMLLSAEGVCVMAELMEKMDGKNPTRITDTHDWLAKFRKKWLQKNKENELYRIEEMFVFCESI